MEAVRLMNKENAFVLDVRTQDEFSQGHISDAINIPLGLVDTRISDIHDKKSLPIILVCQSGNRSMQAARLLKKHGFANIYNLTGGMASWRQANLPVSSGAKSKSGKDKGSSSKPDKKKQHNKHNISSSKPDSTTESKEVVDPQKEKVIVYTSGYCPFTSKVNKLLEEKGVDFQEVNLSGDQDMRNLIANQAGQSTFPQVFRGDIHIGNCDELYQLEKDGKLNSILGLKHA